MICSYSHTAGAMRENLAYKMLSGVHHAPFNFVLQAPLGNGCAINFSQIITPAKVTF